MPAQPTDIIRAIRQSRIVTDEDTAILTAFPNARDQNDSPTPGYFESASDATTLLALKAALIGAFRRRFAVRINSILELDPLTEIPTYNLVDSEHNVSGDGLVTRIEVDLQEQTTNVELLI